MRVVVGWGLRKEVEKERRGEKKKEKRREGDNERRRKREKERRFMQIRRTSKN